MGGAAMGEAHDNDQTTTRVGGTDWTEGKACVLVCDKVNLCELRPRVADAPSDADGARVLCLASSVAST